jgi:hypothetical protein
MFVWKGLKGSVHGTESTAALLNPLTVNPVMFLPICTAVVRMLARSNVLVISEATTLVFLSAWYLLYVCC